MAQPAVAGLFTPRPGSIYFGAYVNTTGLLGGNTPADAADVEAQLGRLLTLHMQYLTFYGSLSGNKLLDDYEHFRVPVISWNCQYPNAQIASGQWDAQLEIAAAQAKNFGAPVFLRYMWDPNLPDTAMSGGYAALDRTPCWDPSEGDLPKGIFSPSEFIAAWQHVHTVFQNAGATNVIWVWTFSNNPAAQPPMPYYPGSQWVDWVGMDAYDVNGGSFSGTFSSAYATLAALNKPIMIAETGALAAQQPAFFSGAVPALKASFPAVKAFVYYDGINYIQAVNQDWRVSTSAFPAFSAFANDPYMGAQYVP